MSQSDSRLVTIPGSHRPPVDGAHSLGPPDPHTALTLTVQLVPHDPQGLATRVSAIGYTPYTQDEFVAAHAPRTDDLDVVRAYLQSQNLTIGSITDDQRSLSVTGTVADAERAFGTHLMLYEVDGTRFFGRSGDLSLPDTVAPLIEGVFGLDTRPFARPHFRRPVASAPHSLVPLSALDVAGAYRFPAGDGAGQTIGIIELGGGYQDTDLQHYFGQLGLAAPQVLAVGVNGGANQPGRDPSGSDGEVELDIEVAGAVAPQATIVVYFARDSSEQSFVDAVNAVINDRVHSPAIVSISWGGPELLATASARQAMDTAFLAGAALGITFLAAAGDNGSTDQPDGSSLNVDYPAASPYVTGCGGTSLTLTNGAIGTEVVWNDTTAGHGATGGGISVLYPVPPWQAGLVLPPMADGSQRTGRGVPDVAGNADPSSGYTVTIDGQVEPIGGTSAVAPLWAGLIARINAARGSRCGFINPAIYRAAGAGCRDIVKGNNGSAGAPGYTAGAGWDACTGWGSPNGATIGGILSARDPTVRA